MNVRFEDTLEPVGILGGLFIIIMSLVGLLETPWATSLNSFIAAVQVVGIAIMFLVGLTLIWLSYTGDALDGLTDTGAETTATATTAASRDESGTEDTTTADDEESTGDDEEEFGVTLDEAEDE